MALDKSTTTSLVKAKAKPKTTTTTIPRHVKPTPPPKITSNAQASFVAGTPASFTITSTSTAARLAERGTLPPGVVFTPRGDGKAVLSGQPTTPGTYPVTVTATSSTGTSTSQVLTLSVIQAPTVTSPTTDTFVTGTAASFDITATGTPAPTLSEEGALPPGLVFHAGANGTATITGTPTRPGSFPLTIVAQNGATATQHVTLVVDQPAAITSATTASFTVSTPGDFTVTTTGQPTANVSENGALPPGLTFEANANGTATIAGTATHVGDYPITVIATNLVGPVVSQHLSVVVTQPASITTSPVATFTERQAGSFTISSAGWPTPAVRVEGSLPPGLTFTPKANGTATLAGTPTQAGNYELNVIADNRTGEAAVQRISVTVLLTPTSTRLTVRRTDRTASKNTLVLSAVVDPPDAVPTGRVTFLDRSGTLGSAPLGIEGAATLTVTVPVGEHILSASYEPSTGSGFAASTSVPLGYDATRAPILSRAITWISETGSSVTRALEVGGILLLLGAAAAVLTARIQRRRPGRSV